MSQRIRTRRQVITAIAALDELGRWFLDRLTDSGDESVTANGDLTLGLPRWPGAKEELRRVWHILKAQGWYLHAWREPGDGPDDYCPFFLRVVALKDDSLFLDRCTLTFTGEGSVEHV